MRDVVDGRPCATRWSAGNEPGAALVPALREHAYTSRIEGARLLRRACDEPEGWPCGCVDFIPAANSFSFRTP